MSFDLGIWDARRPPGVADARRRFEQLRSGPDGADEPSERVDGFVEECERRWPAGAGPVSGRRSPGGFLASITDDRASELYGEWAEMAERHGVVLYDPQSGIIKIPSRLSFAADPRPPAGLRLFGRR